MRRIIRTIALTLPLLYSAVFATSAIAADDGMTKSPSTRYVWANSLLLRAQPDGKSAQLAKIPYGAALDLNGSDTPVAHTEVFAKYAYKGKTITVTMAGAWQKVHWQDQDGWVFDGYLSRYPTPNTSSFDTWRKNFKNYVSDEIAYADQLFGPGTKVEWDLKRDGVKSSVYQAAQKYMKSVALTFDPSYTRNARWTNIEWKSGASCSDYLLEDDGGFYATSLRNLSLTFNEALLWEMHFNHIDSKDFTTEYNVHYNDFHYSPGSELSIDITDNTGFNVSIKCAGKSCDLATGSTS